MTLRALAVAALVTLTAFAAQAKNGRFSAPHSSERIIVPIPEGWKRVGNNDHFAEYHHEYTPANQSAEDWESMITVMIFPGGNLPQGAAVFLARQSTERLSAICRKHLAQPLVETSRAEVYESAIYAVSCFTRPEAKTSPEVHFHVRNFAFYKGIVVVSRAAAYNVQWTAHIDNAGDGSKKPTENERKNFRAFLPAAQMMEDLWKQGVTLCDLDSSERPCPHQD